MKKSEFKLMLLEIIVIILALFNIFERNIVNEYLIALVFGIMFIISYFLVGFEKERMLDKKKKIGIMIFLAVGFLIIEFGLGLILGFQKSLYSTKFTTLIRNILPVLILVITSEMFRYQLCTKGDRNIFVLVLNVIMFTTVDILMQIHLYNLDELSDIILMLVTVGTTSVCRNILLCNCSYKYGYTLTLVYSLIYSVYVYFVPIFPNYNGFIKTVIRIISPIITMLMINNLFRDKAKKEEYDRKHNIISKTLTLILVVVLISVIVLVSNLFRFWAVSIASGSMSPTIDIGDIVIVDKMYQKHPEKLKNGDILVFRVKDKLYTHRITNILNVDSEYYIKTKGDREGQEEDFWTVREDDVVGVVKFKIKYIGYPTVWLNELKKKELK